jgi:hypothetical protein
VWRPTTAAKRDWRSRHTATDPNGVKSRDVTTPSDRHIIWRPSKDPHGPPDEIIAAGNPRSQPADRRSGVPEWRDRRRSPRIRSACLATSADRRSGFPEWRDRRRSPRIRSACLTPSANRRSGFPEWRDRRRSPRIRSACLAPSANRRSGFPEWSQVMNEKSIIGCIVRVGKLCESVCIGKTISKQTGDY